MAPVGCVPARALTPLVLLTAVHTLTCCVIITLAPATNVTTGVGKGVGTGVGAGDGTAQPDTVIMGTVPAEENATAQPAGAKTCSGTVTVTAPAVVLAVPVGVGVCASAGTGAIQSKASKIFPFLFIGNLFYYIDSNDIFSRGIAPLLKKNCQSRGGLCASAGCPMLNFATQDDGGLRGGRDDARVLETSSCLGSVHADGFESA
jgi:hypothetical protein